MRRAVVALVTVVIAITVAGCGSEAEPNLTAAEYRLRVEAVCTATNERRAALVEPADAAAVTEFAETVARDLSAEAENIRAIRPPDELDDDHRAFVQNTADQAAAWQALADTSPSDTEAFGAASDAIAELSFGRDDLATAMSVEACRRSQ